MSLRRTGLARKSELKRKTALARTQLQQKREARSRTVKATKRPRDTGPSIALRGTVAMRAGYACERCGLRLHNGTAWTQVHSFHHRLPRGRGGRNTATNIVLLCGSGTTGCHGQVESQRTASYDSGWLVETGINPASKPVLVHTLGHVLLTEDGDYEEAA